MAIAGACSFVNRVSVLLDFYLQFHDVLLSNTQDNLRAPSLLDAVFPYSHQRDYSSSCQQGGFDCADATSSSIVVRIVASTFHLTRDLTASKDGSLSAKADKNPLMIATTEPIFS